MKLISKFEIGQDVFFLNDETRKIERGTIYSVNASVDNKRTVEWIYFIQTPKKDGEILSLLKSVKEYLVFANRDDVFNLAYGMTENI